MNLLDLSRAAATLQTNHSILLYGQPGTGKTLLAGTAAKIPELARIFWFDLENGAQTLINMGLTDEELTKITLIKIADTKNEPIGIETMLRVVGSRLPLKICELHGKVDCAPCAKSHSPSITFSLSSCTHNDLIVIDSGSQLGDSALNAACLNQPDMFKPGFDEYGRAGKWLGDVLSVIQQCANTNFLVITHEIALEDDEKKDRLFPLMGTKNFSMKCAKYFGTRVYVHKKMNKHTAGSASTYRTDLLTGSRINARVEDAKSGPDMRQILIDGGILKSKSENKGGEDAEVKEQVIPPDKKETIPDSNGNKLADLLEAKRAAKLAQFSNAISDAGNES